MGGIERREKGKRGEGEKKIMKGEGELERKEAKGGERIGGKNPVSGNEEGRETLKK